MDARLERLVDKPARIHLLGATLTVITAAAVVGGALLLADPSGSLLGMSVGDMGAAPFRDFSIPGLVLLLLFGLAPIPVLVGLWKGRRWAREVAGMLGAALTVWITAQVIWFGLVTPVQALVWLAGVALLAFGGAPVWRRTMR